MPDYLIRVDLPRLIASWRVRRTKATDEMLFEALEQIHPPLLSGPDDVGVRSILQGKRGPKPKGTPGRHELSRRIAELDRADVPRGYLDALAERIKHGKRYTEFDRCKADYRQRCRRNRDMFIRGIYRQLYALQTGKDTLEHPVLGSFEVPMNIRTRSGRALAMTSRIMQERLRLDPPSRRRMMNIISRN